ncbi:MAG: flagellar biosynthesis anti-sigma factor FlgM [Methylococcales bacterium]|nr:flagellar biosynthesis anti-sigma factor FlgM [Methylococcales bacterium]
MAIEIKPGAKSFATLYQIQPKNPANSDKFDAALADKIQTLGTTTDASTSTPVESSDRVVFTNVIQEMRRRIDASSEQTVDLEKVARIRQAIEDGSYIANINPDRIAAKILNYAH